MEGINNVILAKCTRYRCVRYPHDRAARIPGVGRRHAGEYAAIRPDPLPPEEHHDRSRKRQVGGASFRVSQKGYEGRFRGIIQCQVGLLKQPRIDIDGHTVTIIVPAQRVVVSVGCYATIEGGDGATGEEPILIDIGLD